MTNRMNNREYSKLLRNTIAAIHNGESALIVDTGKAQPDVYFNLPTFQATGTTVQRASYALQAAKDFLANHGIKRDENIF